MAPTTAITATAITAKFRTAYLFCPAIWLTIAAIQWGKGFDCNRLSTMIFRGQGSRRSVTVSPITATRARAKVFQCGRNSSTIFGHLEFAGGMGAVAVSGIFELLT